MAAFAASLVASLAAVVGMSVAPAAAGTNGPTSYEVDCVGTSLAAGQTAPFIQGLNVNTNVPDPSPSGTSFGVSGAATTTLIGPIIAGAYQQVNLALTGGLAATIGNETIGTTDGSATGSFTYNHAFPSQPAPGAQRTGVTWTAPSTTLTAAAGTFQASDVGTPTNPMFVAGPGPSAGDGIDPNSTVVSVAADGSSITISLATLAAQSTGVNVGLGQSLTFVDPTLNTGNVFTSSGAAHSNIGVTSMASITLSTAFGGIVVPFGGASGTSLTAADPRCLLTGYDAAGNPGPSQFGDTTPADPVIMHPQYVAAGITPLVAASGGFITQPQTAQAITPPAAAFVTAVACTNPTAPSITTTSLADAKQGRAYSATVQATGGDPPLHDWTATGLPAGLSINASTGEISGTPTVSGDFSTTVTVTDSCPAPAGPRTATTTLALHVNAPLAIATTSLPDATEFTAYTTTLQATGGVPPNSWSATGLPTGLSVNSSTGVISGTPACGTAGDFSVAVTVTDSDTPIETATATLALHVNGNPACVTDAAMNAIAGNPRSAAGHKTVVAKVTNVGGVPFQVCDTNISWSMLVGATDVTGSVTPLNPGCATLAPGASKRFRFNWDYGTSLTGFVGSTVDITGTVTVAGDAVAGNNSDTEHQTVK